MSFKQAIRLRKRIDLPLTRVRVKTEKIRQKKEKKSKRSGELLFIYMLLV